MERESDSPRPPADAIFDPSSNGVTTQARTGSLRMVVKAMESKILPPGNSEKTALWFNVALDMKNYKNNVVRYASLVHESCKRLGIDRDKVPLDWGDGTVPDYMQLEDFSSPATSRLTIDEVDADDEENVDSERSKRPAKSHGAKPKKKKTFHPEDEYDLTEDFIDDSDVYIRFNIQDLDTTENKAFMRSIKSVVNAADGNIIVGHEDSSEQDRADIFADDHGFFVWRGSLVNFEKVKDFLKQNEGEDSKPMPTFEVSYQPPAPSALNLPVSSQSSPKKQVLLNAMDVDITAATSSQAVEGFATPKKTKKSSGAIKDKGALPQPKVKKASKSALPSKPPQLEELSATTETESAIPTPGPDEYDARVLKLRVTVSKLDPTTVEKKKKLALRKPVASRLAALGEKAVLQDWSLYQDSFPPDLVPLLKAFAFEHFFNPAHPKYLKKLNEGSRIPESFVANLLNILPYSVADLQKLCNSLVIPERIKRQKAALQLMYDLLDKDIRENSLVPIEPIPNPVPAENPASVEALVTGPDETSSNAGALNSSAIAETAELVGQSLPAEKTEEKKNSSTRRVMFNSRMRETLYEIIEGEDRLAHMEHEYSSLFGKSKKKSSNTVKTLVFSKVCDRFPTNWLKRSSLSVQYIRHLKSMASAVALDGGKEKEMPAASTPAKASVSKDLGTPKTIAPESSGEVFSTPRKVKHKSSLESFFPHVDGSPNNNRSTLREDSEETSSLSSLDGNSPSSMARRVDVSEMASLTGKVERDMSAAAIANETKKKRKLKVETDGEPKKKATPSLMVPSASTLLSFGASKKNIFKPIGLGSSFLAKGKKSPTVDLMQLQSPKLSTKAVSSPGKSERSSPSSVVAPAAKPSPNDQPHNDKLSVSPSKEDDSSKAVDTLSFETSTM